MPGGRNDSGSSWAADLRFEVFDFPVRVRLSDGVVAERLSELLQPFERDDSTPVQPENIFTLAEQEHLGKRVLRRGEELVATGEAWGPLIASLVAEVNASAVAAMRCFAAHAGAVADSEGVLAFPAESGGGKSTLTASFLLLGFDYVSDEALCIDFEDCQVMPYPKPLGLASHSVDLLGLAQPAEAGGEALITPQELGARAVEGKLPLQHVLEIERRPGEPELIEMPRSEIVAWLLRASFNHYKWPEESFRLVGDLARTCRAWKLRYADPMPAAHLVRERLAALG